jgi:L-seryl-tRNA(Ser) seleniumtransferase
MPTSAVRKLATMRPPSVDALARRLAEQFELPHPLLVDAARAAIAAGDPEAAAGEARAIERRLLGPVVNATGVLLHTNLGRAPVAHTAAATYTNLELDLTTGRRGSRHDHVGHLGARACGAEAALVVNNGAAAVLLVLAALAAGRDVVVSRGELVEIGGGFRVPEVMAQSGARLVEVGTTNRTRRADYTAALDASGDVALLLKVHTSNYRITGFTASVEVADLATVGPPVVVDLGSGLLDQTCPWLADGRPSWLGDEPAVRQTLAAGAALVTFSGDKLLGGPQAGIVAGRSDLVQRCARHPLSRALRPGGLVLAALQQTLLAYLRRDAEAIPFWRMASVSVAELRARAEALGVGQVTNIVAVAGAGSLPGRELPSAGVFVAGDHALALRDEDPPVIARVRQGRTWIDLRTVDPSDDAHVAKALARREANQSDAVD